MRDVASCGTETARSSASADVGELKLPYAEVATVNNSATDDICNRFDCLLYLLLVGRQHSICNRSQATAHLVLHCSTAAAPWLMAHQ
jgi:hypothetical protein